MFSPRSRSVPLRLTLLLLVPLLPAEGCASRDRGALPTLRDYSDGTSVFVETLHAQWKTGRLSPDLFAADFHWVGPLPGESLTPVAARPPLTIAVFRSAPSGAPAV